MEIVSRHIQKLRWATRIATGYDPRKSDIPKRFKEVRTWKGPVDKDYLQRLKEAYAKKILELAVEGNERSGE